MTNERVTIEGTSLRFAYDVIKANKSNTLFVCPDLSIVHKNILRATFDREIDIK